MTSSNAVTDPAPVAGTPAEPAPAVVDGGPVAPFNTAPFEFLPVGDAFGVCDVDGECR